MLESTKERHGRYFRRKDLVFIFFRLQSPNCSSMRLGYQDNANPNNNKKTVDINFLRNKERMLSSLPETDIFKNTS